MPATCVCPQPNHRWPRHPAASKSPASQHAPAACVSPQANHRWPHHPAASKPPTSQHTPAACISPQANNRWPPHPAALKPPASRPAPATCVSPPANPRQPRRQWHQSHPPRSTRLLPASDLQSTTCGHVASGIEAARLAAHARRLRQTSSQPQAATSLAALQPPISRPAPAACVNPLANHSWPRFQLHLSHPPRGSRPPLASAFWPTTASHITSGIDAARLAARARRLC